MFGETIDGVFVPSESRLVCRTTDTNGVFGEAMDVPPEMVNYMDVSPRQMNSVATALIPFLEHDDANRALMGSNMQRQAVPLLLPHAPYVGTGIEHRIAVRLGELPLAKHAGTVDYVDGSTIIIRMMKASSTSTWFRSSSVPTRAAASTTSPSCPQYGDEVQAGDALADGPSTDHAELALGQNLMVAYMTWEGYNYEDAIIISERVVGRGPPHVYPYF